MSVNAMHRPGRPDTRAGGFTLIEFLVSVVLLGVIMASAVGLLMSQRNLYDIQNDKIALQTNVRAAVDMVASELRTIPDGGVVKGAADSVVVRYPFRWGLVCGAVTPPVIKDSKDPPPAPTDADVYMPDVSDPLFVGHAQSGIAYRDSNGDWTFVDGSTEPWESTIYAESRVTCASSPTSTEKVTYDKEGNLISGDTTTYTGTEYRRWIGYNAYTGQNAVRGAQVIAYSTVTYRFGPSVFEPGTRALFRVTSAGAQELSGLFDDDSAFEYVLENGTTYDVLPAGQEKNVAEILIKAFATKANQAGATDRALDYDATVHVPLRNTGEEQ